MWKIKNNFYFAITYFDLLLATVLGCILSFSNPPFSFSYFIVIVLSVLGYYWLKKRLRPGSSFLFGFFFGVGYFSFSLVWIIEPFFIDPDINVIFAPFALLFLSALLSLFWGIAFFFSSYKNDYFNKKKSLLKLIILLSFAEFLRSFLFTGFPWVLLGLVFIDTPISQALSIFGPYWLTFIIIFLSLIIPLGFSGIILSLVGFSFLNLFGLSRYDTIHYDESFNEIRIIQPNIAQKDKWKKELGETHFNKLVQLSNKNASNVDLLIWPETSVPSFLEYKRSFPKDISSKIDNPIILGVRRYDKDTNKLFNSAYFLSSDGQTKQIYDKKHLVPFGEYVPFIKFINVFVDIGEENNGITGFSVGEKTNELIISDTKTFAVFICYESIFSNEVDRNITNSDLIIHLTNDAWFGSYSGPQQHIVHMKARAIEQGLPVIRSANTGISGLIDPYGKIIEKIPLNLEGYLDVRIPKKLEKTLYSEFGSLNWHILLISLFALLYILCFKRENKIR